MQGASIKGNIVTFTSRVGAWSQMQGASILPVETVPQVKLELGLKCRVLASGTGNISGADLLELGLK